jgi:hypothetical protein
MSSYGIIYSPIPNVVKSQGYDYGYTDTYVEPKSELDCPYNKPVFVAAQTTPNDIGGVSVFSAYCKSPEKPSDCKEGTIFQDGGYSKGGATYDEYGRRTSGYALPVKRENKCVKQKSCEQQYLEYLAYIKKYGPQIRMIQKTKEEFMAECNGTKIPTPVPLPLLDGYGEGYGYEQLNKCKGDFKVECNDGSCDVTNGAVAPCLTRGGVKGITSVNPVEKVVEAIKPKTEEEEYRNFIYLAMAGIGVYLLLSE